jgi:hypothetical protein
MNNEYTYETWSNAMARAGRIAWITLSNVRDQMVGYLQEEIEELAEEYPLEELDLLKEATDITCEMVNNSNYVIYDHRAQMIVEGFRWFEPLGAEELEEEYSASCNALAAIILERLIMEKWSRSQG